MTSKVTRLPRPTPGHHALDQGVLQAIVSGRLAARCGLGPSHAAVVMALAGLGPDANNGRRA